jgi:hypothetical protein
MVAGDATAGSTQKRVVGTDRILHWGLENDQVTNTFLANTPLGQPYKGITRLEAFKKIRQFLKKGHAPVFDNYFSSRMGL